jgi:phage-related tail fiber protein
VSDIVDNLTTNVSSKVLSAAQGVAIKELIDALQEELDAHTHTITASATDDDVVILTGTNGINGVTYSASHADSTVNAGTYKSVTVDNKGHVTSGTNPTTLEGYGITDAYNKDEIDAELAKKSNTEHTHIASEITDLQPLLNEKVSITTTINGKELGNNITLVASDVNAYSKTEIDNMELITVADIDTICGANIYAASEVTL